MIGQKHLINKINTLIENNKLPRFIILCGDKGSGRKTIASYIAKRANLQLVISDIKVDDVRNVIKVANSTYLETLYVFSDADKMSTSAENALLKFLEEPPNKSYILITVENLTNLLYTIRSRGTVMTMDKYKAVEIYEYFWMTYPQANPNDAEIVERVCETPGDVNALAYTARSLYDYALLVFDKIGEVAGANALKIGSKLALKDEEDKYDLRLFFKLFIYQCFEQLGLMPMQYVQVTNKYLRQLSIKGVNKSMLFDNWVLDIREIYFNYN